MVGIGRHRYGIHAGSERIRPAEGLARRSIDFADAVGRRLVRGRGSLTRSYERQLRAFLDCVRAGRGALQPSPGTMEGIAAILAIAAARASLERDGAETAVPPVPAR